MTQIQCAFPALTFFQPPRGIVLHHLLWRMPVGMAQLGRISSPRLRHREGMFGRLRLDFMSKKMMIMMRCHLLTYYCHRRHIQGLQHHCTRSM